MNTKQSITKAYSRAAEAYAAAFWNELDKKPFDQILLRWFATQIPAGEMVLEIGAGPGEVSGFLSQEGASCLATDRSPQMIEVGRKYFPQVRFEVQDFLQLSYSDQSFQAVIAYYAIVNLTLAEIERALAEVQRVLKQGGLFLFTFHVFEGQEKTDVENFFDLEGNRLTFYYFKVGDLKERVERAGFQVVDILTRYPYKEVEYQSKRAYVIARKP